MILISKDERDAVVEAFPHVRMVRTVKQKSKRHRYYCEEDRRVMKFINGLRNGNSTEKSKESGSNSPRSYGKRDSVKLS